jgi:hypothetical protein
MVLLLLLSLPMTKSTTIFVEVTSRKPTNFAVNGAVMARTPLVPRVRNVSRILLVMPQS